MKMTAFTDSEYTYLHEFELDGIKERVERVCSAFEWVADGTCINVVSEFSGSVAHRMDVGDSDDAEFIAHARQDVPALIAEVERLREALEGEKKSSEWASREWKAIRERSERSNDYLKREMELMREENTRLREALQQIQNSDVWFIDSDINEEDAYLRCVEIADKALGGESDE